MLRIDYFAPAFGISPKNSSLKYCDEFGKNPNIVKGHRNLADTQDETLSLCVCVDVYKITAANRQKQVPAILIREMRCGYKKSSSPRGQNQ